MNTSPNISSFKSKFLPMASEELAELQQFAISEGFTGVLELWDIPYWKRKHKEHLYRYVASYALLNLLEFYFEVSKFMKSILTQSKISNS